MAAGEETQLGAPGEQFGEEGGKDLVVLRRGKDLVILRRLNAPTSECEDVQVVEREPTPPMPQEAGEDENKAKCGLLHCFRKVLERLPSVGGDMEESSKEFERSLRFGARQVIHLITPVSICMLIVVAFQLSIAAVYTGPQQQAAFLPFNENSSSGGTNFLFGLVNVIVIIVLVVIMTTLLIILLKYRCDKAIIVLLLVVSGILVFVATSLFYLEILMVRNIVADWITFIFIIWNYGSLGLVVILWKGPLRLQQAYLILNSGIVAVNLIRIFPDWTTWTLLAAISVYDLFAVLCPKGPLRILVDTANERGEINLPSLIYSSTMIVGMADIGKKSAKNSGKFPKGQPQKSASNLSGEIDGEGFNEEDIGGGTIGMEMNEDTATQQHSGEQDGTEQHAPCSNQRCHQVEQEEEEEARGFKLGLGDFIFYSVLVGKAALVSEGNWVIIVSCFVAILIGLCLTCLILGIMHRALPALPISIFFGLVFYFSSQYILAPYVEVLNVNQVFI